MTQPTLREQALRDAYWAHREVPGRHRGECCQDPCFADITERWVALVTKRAAIADPEPIPNETASGYARRRELVAGARDREALQRLTAAVGDYVWEASPRTPEGTCEVCGVKEGEFHDPARVCGRLGDAQLLASRALADDGLDSWAEVEAALDGRVLRVEYDPTVNDLPWMAEVLEATVSDVYVAAHVDSDSPGGALEALLDVLAAGRVP